MSLAAKVVSNSSGEKRTHLLIDDQPYQFLPNLAALYGDTIATMLQQLHWVMHTRPWFDGEELLVREFQGRFWIRVHSFMWFDTLHGICRHLSKSNFYKLRGEMKSSGVLLTLDNLDGDEDEEMLVNSNTKSEGPKWYAINIEMIQEDERLYLEARNEALARRKAERAYIKKNDPNAHWRPRRGQDVSKSLDHCRVIFSEHQPDELAESGIGNGVSTFRTRQVSADDESDLGVSNNGNHCVQDVESNVSQNWTRMSPVLGDTTLYVRETALEKAKTTTTAPLESTPIVTPNGVVVVESSNDNVPPVTKQQRQRTPKNTAPSDTVQVSLPIAASVEKAGAKLPTDPAHPAVELTLRLLNLAAEELIELSEVDAQTIVGAWPAANYSRQALVERLVELKLPRTVAQQFVKANEMECRWQFQLWERRPQTRIGYFQSEGGKVKGDRIGALRAAITQGWGPDNPANWLSALKADLSAQKRREQFELDKVEAGDYFDSLRAPRRKRFIEDLLPERLREKAVFEVGSEAWDMVRVSMLLDPKVRAQIEAWGAKPAASEVAAPSEEPQSAITPKVAARLALYVSRFKFALEDGDFTRDELGAKCRSQAGVSAAEAQWIEGEVLAALDQRKAA